MDEAEELTRVSEETAADDDVLSHVLWRVARARCRAPAAPEEAHALAAAAVHLARTVESPAMLGTALLEQARALHRTGETVQATAVAREAREVFAAKGFTVGVDMASALTMPARTVDLTVGVPTQRTVDVSDAETRVPPA
jgi:hypothetical protein